MTLTYAWLIVLTCANIALLGLVVYAILRPKHVQAEVKEIMTSVQALSGFVSRLDGQVDDVRAMLFGVDAPSAKPVPNKKATPSAKKVTRKAPAKKAIKTAK